MLTLKLTNTVWVTSIVLVCLVLDGKNEIKVCNLLIFFSFKQETKLGHCELPFVWRLSYNSLWQNTSIFLNAIQIHNEIEMVTDQVWIMFYHYLYPFQIHCRLSKTHTIRFRLGWIPRGVSKIATPTIKCP